MKLYSSLKSNLELLKQYDGIATAQKELGIVEDVKSPLSTAPLGHKGG